MEFLAENGILVSSKHNNEWIRVMPEEKKPPQWLTIGQAIDHPDCKVKSRTTLHAMIARGDIQDKCLDYRPLGDGRTVTYIDANCLDGLPYRGHGERGHGKRDD
jgi:hypothetical protein